MTDTRPANRAATAAEDRFFLVVSVFIGIFAGLAVVCFRMAIVSLKVLLLGPELQPPAIRLMVAPVAIGLVVAILARFVFPDVRGSGVTHTKAALYIYDGYISVRTAIGKFITSSLAIGSGHSLGPEDPSLQIGATAASFIGRKLRLPREKLRLIAPVGAAAGLSAAFNAPISAILFVIEEVIGRWSAAILGSVVLSSVSSVVVAQWFLGSEPLFRIPAVEPVRPSELIGYAALGLAGGVASVVFSQSIARLRASLAALPAWTALLQPAAAGALIGGIGVAGFPQVMSAGYEWIDAALHGQFAWKMLLMLALLKMVATILSFASGTPGGMFAPTLYVGAMLGAGVGELARAFAPAVTGPTSTYALVGMGVLFAAFLRAPITSVFMVLEVTGSYTIIVPVLVANTIAYLVGRALQPTSIFELLTRQSGVELPSLEELREESLMRVEDVMDPWIGVVLLEEESNSGAAHRAVASANGDLLVRRRDGWSLIGREELAMLGKQNPGGVLGESGLLRITPSLYGDQPVELALRLAHVHGTVPVVHRARRAEVVGVVTFAGVVHKLGELRYPAE